MFSLAQRAAKQRNATQRSARSSRQSDKTGGGAENRATRLPGESQGGGAGSGCELTPSHVLAEVYPQDALQYCATVRGASCYKLHAQSLRELLHHPSLELSQIHTRPLRLLHQHAAYLPAEGERIQRPASTTTNNPLETSITTCLARRPRAPKHTSGTSRRLFRARESEISTRPRWPGRLCHLSRPPSLSLCSHPFVLPPSPPFLPLSLLPSATVSQGIRKYPPTHTDLEMYSPLAKLPSPPDTLSTPSSS